MTLSNTFSAMSDPTRQRILELLKKRDMPAGQIGKHFPITAPSLTHHLNILKQSDLISSRREGQEIIYTLNLTFFEEAAEKIIKFFKI
jgi:ArsR family transcriptional regulator, arsenate/arsenite/antimonite-responsive transcriptional repressor